jgi:hypothetical protein
MKEMESVTTMKQEMDYQINRAESEMRHGREETIRALKQILENAATLLKSIEDNPDELAPMNNERVTMWINQGNRNLDERVSRWYNASQRMQNSKFLQKLYEKENKG